MSFGDERPLSYDAPGLNVHGKTIPGEQSMSQTTITVLCENTAAGPMGLLGEHGFAALIQGRNGPILFDTGQSISLANNARVLGIDLRDIDTVVLSHGHYDHTGGLPDVLKPPRNVEIISHPDIFRPKYAELQGPQGPVRPFIGIKYRREYLQGACGARFTFHSQPTEIRPGMLFSGEVPRKTDFEHPDTRLKVEQNGQLGEDPLLDDASLLVETESGPVILLGCAHAGVVNVMNHFAEQTGHRRFHAVIGGTHLGFMGGPGPQLDKAMDAFDDYGVELIGVAHCTGQEAAALCRHRFKDRFAFASVGWSRTF
jgi:7,8-dihydropterin-6-yl-methyl-4-(beta-D-ribofuranosyl)aminobenzene 5'-phosphate synthase